MANTIIAIKTWTQLPGDCMRCPFYDKQALVCSATILNDGKLYTDRRAPYCPLVEIKFGRGGYITMVKEDKYNERY